MCKCVYIYILYVYVCVYIHTICVSDAYANFKCKQAELESHRDRADAMEIVLKMQTAELREKLVSAQREIDDLKNAMENMVPRCVYVFMYIFLCVYIDIYMYVCMYAQNADS